MTRHRLLCQGRRFKYEAWKTTVLAQLRRAAHYPYLLHIVRVHRKRGVLRNGATWKQRDKECTRH
jgi:hypothetical protein